MASSDDVRDRTKKRITVFERLHAAYESSHQRPADLLMGSACREEARRPSVRICGGRRLGICVDRRREYPVVREGSAGGFCGDVCFGRSTLQEEQSVSEIFGEGRGRGQGGITQFDVFKNEWYSWRRFGLSVGAVNARILHPASRKPHPASSSVCTHPASHSVGSRMRAHGRRCGLWFCVCPLKRGRSFSISWSEREESVLVP